MPFVPDDFGFPVLISPQRSLAELDSILRGADLEADAPPASPPVSRRAARKAERDRIGQIMLGTPADRRMTALHLATEFPALPAAQIVGVVVHYGRSLETARRRAVALCKASVA